MALVYGTRSFEEAFKYDDHRRPRVWSAQDNINDVYDAARRQARQVLELYATAQLDLAALVRRERAPLVLRRAKAR